MRKSVTALLAALMSLGCAAARAAVMARAVPAGALDDVVVCRTASGRSVLERWRVRPVSRAARREVPFEARDLVVKGGELGIVGAHALYVTKTDLSAPPRRIWSTPRNILRVAARAGEWLALAALPPVAGHPRAGQVWRIAGGKAYRLALLERYNFWEMQVGDTVGNGGLQLALCTWSKTRLVPRYARRYFVYGWHDGDLFPLWRGSRLSRPYLQARLVPLGAAGPLKLLSAEVLPDGHHRLVAYRWNDFGYAALAQSGVLHDVRLLECDSPVPLAAVGRPPKLCTVALAERDLRLRALGALPPDAAVVVGRFGASRRGVLVLPRGDIRRARSYVLTGGPAWRAMPGS